MLTASTVAARLTYAHHQSRQIDVIADRTVTADDGVQLLGDRGRLVFFDQLGRDLGTVIDNKPSGPLVLSAHSMGGMAALALVRERPELFGERIVAAALLSTAAGDFPATAMPPLAARVAVNFRLVTPAAWLLWLIAPILERIAPFRKHWGRQWLLHRFGGENPPEEAATKMQDSLIRTPLSIAAAFYPALVTYNVHAALDTLRKIPVLVLSGTEDRAIPYPRSEHLAREIGPSTRLITVEHAGHRVNLTQPDQVNEALREFFDNLWAGPGHTSKEPS